jgi:uncharacterized protein (DUF1800 family)
MTMIDRRSFMKMMGASGISALNISKISEALFTAPRGAFLPSTIGRDNVAHVISRLTYGVTPQLYSHAQAIGIEAFIEEQLNPTTLSDANMEARLADFPIVQQSSADIFAEYEKDQSTVVREFLGAWMTNIRYSERQLYQRMVEFWSDHFHVYIRKGIVGFLKIDDDRAIRPVSFGKFRDILGASAKSPAMLFYLDNAQSQDRAPNENYGRELLELHTLGVNGGYTENDVKEVARAFTGWSIPRPDEFSGDLFLFRPRAHDDGEKVVLGNILPANNGIQDGEMVLDILAQHPSTARFISKKLARRFVSDNPSDALIAQLASVFMETGGDSVSLLRAILDSDEFWNAPPKFKRPFDYTMSLLRALDMQVTNTQQFGRFLIGMLEGLGQIPFMWAAPNGYPDIGAYWMNNLLPRWNAVLGMMNPTRIYTPNFDALSDLLTATGATSIEDIITFWGTYLFGRTLTDAEFSTIYDFSLTISGDIPERAAAAFALCLATPAFQYR